MPSLPLTPTVPEIPASAFLEYLRVVGPLCFCGAHQDEPLSQAGHELSLRRGMVLVFHVGLLQPLMSTSSLYVSMVGPAAKSPFLSYIASVITPSSIAIISPFSA